MPKPLVKVERVSPAEIAAMNAAAIGKGLLKRADGCTKNPSLRDCLGWAGLGFLLQTNCEK